MQKREKLNKLVVMILDTSNSPQTARQMYDNIRFEQPNILKQEHISTFKSFVAVVRAFSEVKAKGFQGKMRTYNLVKFK